MVHKISINWNFSALLLVGSDALCVMYLYGRASSKDDAIICRYGNKMVMHYRFSLNFTTNELLFQF